MGRKQFHRLLLSTICVTILTSGAGYLRPLITERMERLAFDFHSSALPTPEGQSQVVMVQAGEPSFERMGSWPWARKFHAQVLGSLGMARAVLLDIVMPEVSTPDSDGLLAAVVQTMGNVVVACHVAPTPDSGPMLVYPHDSLLRAAARIGITNVTTDVDGYLRAVRPVWNIDGQAMEGFAMAGFTLLAESPPELLPVGNIYELRAGNRAIPLDASGSMWVQTGSTPITRYEYWDVLTGQVPPETFKDKIVVVGIAASGAADFHLVPDLPGAREMSGAEFNAKALSTMLFGRVPVRVAPTVAALLTACLCLTGALLATRRPYFALLGLATVSLAYFIAVHELFVASGIWADATTPLIGILASFTLTKGLRYSFMHRDWELKTLSVNRIANMDPQSVVNFKTFEEFLISIWPDIAGGTGVHLMEAPTSVNELDKRFLPHEGGGPVIAQPGPHGLKRGIALPIPHDDHGRPYVLLGWNRTVNREAIQSLSAVILSSAWFFTNMKEAANRKAMLIRTIRSVFKALDYRDPITGGHSNRVSSLVLDIMNHMKLNDSKLVEDIYLGALVHDVGKIGIPDAVLQKTGKLTDEEYNFIKRHPDIGFGIMESAGLPKATMQTLTEHHERFDGSGYPAGLAGNDISLGGRITAVADVFDALTSDRPYRTGWTEEETCNYIQSLSGTHFDPTVVDIFIDLKNTCDK